MMSCKNKKHSFFLILFKLLLLMILWSAASSSCPSECGGVSIPYPFGIGNSCYLEKSYEIECRSTTTSRKLVPFLSVINKEVVSIDLPEVGYSVATSYGIVRIRSPITYTGCFTSTDRKESGAAPIMNLTGSSMFIDSINSLVAVGCNSMVSFTHVKPNIVGCELNCSMIKESHNILNVPGCSRNILYSYGTRHVCTDDEQTTCRGNGCQASLPSIPQQVLGIRIESNDGNSTRKKQEHCRVAFLTDETYSLSNGTNPQKLLAKGHSTFSLGWILQTKNTSYLNSLACEYGTEFNSRGFVERRIKKCICEIVSNSSETRYANCVCNEGYSGNPYIVNGCVDTNECESGTYSCEEGQHCVNTLGHYKCVGDKTRSILIGAGSGFGVLALVGGVWCLRKFLIKRRIAKRKKKFFKRNGGLLLQQELNTSDGNVEKTKIFSSKELEKATENFSENRVLGQGGQGTVYKGMLLDGRTVAVKKSKVIDEDKLQEFINEVVILSQINHRHIVKLLGCCLETEVPILVYEFILNGDLFQHIHEEFDDYTMIWGMRLRIAVDAAGALSYLHSSASSAIYHRDIKSTNILLDEKHRAKVADFGTSRSITIDQTHWTTVVSGTVGYLDPEYYRSSQYTDKSDVYSFGVVLAELVTGDKPVVKVQNTQEIISLAEHFKRSMKEERLSDIIDARIKDDCRPEQVTAMANLAVKCLSSKGKKRPNIREVFTELERICSSPEDSQVLVVIDEEEEVRNMVTNGDSLTAGVTVPAFSIAASPSSSDAGPLFPRPTW